jgi:hypothetical protein
MLAVDIDIFDIIAEPRSFAASAIDGNLSRARGL